MPHCSVREPPEIARQELRQFMQLARQTGLDPDHQRLVLRLSPDDWEDWLGFLDDAPLPERPALPLMLRHLGFVTNRLDRAAQAQHSPLLRAVAVGAAA